MNHRHPLAHPNSGSRPDPASRLRLLAAGLLAACLLGAIAAAHASAALHLVDANIGLGNLVSLVHSEIGVYEKHQKHHR